MFLQKYLHTIEGIDPGKIYVENVRSLFNISHTLARFICEVAVKDSVFSKQIGLVCPNCNRVIAHYSSIAKIPQNIVCHICESEEQEQYSFNTTDLQKIEFYQLKK